MRISRLIRYRLAIIELVMIWVGLFPVAQAATGKQSPYMFRHITTSDGLLNNNITTLYRDSKGFLWVGTTAGLNRYDSYHFLSFFDNASQRQGNHILNIFEDWDGQVWTETQFSYAYFDYETDRFNDNWKGFLEGLHITDSIQKMGVNAKRDILWAYNTQNLYIYNKRQDNTKKIPIRHEEISEVHVFDEYLYIMYQSGKLIAININTLSVIEHPIPTAYLPFLSEQYPKLFVDHSGGIWVHAFQNSKLYYKRNLSTDWEEIHLATGQNLFNRIRDITEDENGNIWIITSHLGAFILKPGSENFTQLTNNPFQPQSIPSNNLTSIYADADGIIWLGTFKKGVSYFSPLAQVFQSCYILPNSDIISFHEDRENIWLGTDGGGLIKLSEAWDTTPNTAIQANIIQAITSDSTGCLWIGTYQNGLFRYDGHKAENITTRNSGLDSDIIYDLFFDKKGDLWLATLNGAVQKYNAKSRTFETKYKADLNIHSLAYDGDHRLYAATSKGLLGIDMETGENRMILMDDTPIITLIKDSQGRVWMGNSEGLTCYDIKTKTFKRLTIADGLSSNSITAIAEDNNQQIWVGTVNGLNRLKWNGKTYNIARYYESDGIASNSINERAIYKLHNGNLVLGTSRGFTLIIPQDIVSSSYNKEVHLTGLESPLFSISKKLSKLPLESIQELSLPEGYTSVSAQFSTLDFHNKGQVSYYMCVSNKDTTTWVKMRGNEINATWLPKGTYHLKIKACNANGEFSPESKLFTVHIYPPFYRTKWAFLCYALIGVTFICIIQTYVRNRRKKKTQIEIAAKEHEHQKKMMDVKMQFFANVSHELRTPLTLIINPLEEFMAKHPQFQNSLLSTVSQNSKYLLELINQLLDFRKLDAAGESINYVHCDIVAFTRDQFQAFENMAARKRIHYTFSSSQASIMMDCDLDKIRKIILNLLSNAFKFTKDEGHISLEISTEIQDKAHWVKFTFKDNGCGITEQEKEKIFNCFYQAESQDHSQGGSGIGLYLVKQYVDLHHGKISVTDNTPQGTIFNILLPMCASSKQGVTTNAVTKANKDLNIAKNDSYTIVVVDDNLDFLNFLAACLSMQYNVLKATNGEEALHICTQENIDLVISDVMMPVMNGLQLCKAIKSDINISHIPVILLTARVSDEHQVEGFNYGADDYITKPFSMDILRLRVKKILESQLKRQERFDREVKIEPSKITITPLDQQFIQKAIQVVEENLGNPEFTVEQLANALNLSRGHFYKKLSKITGKSPMDFIHLIRLKRSQQLLQESQMQVAEIAYKVGYSTPKLFTKHFKETFGMTPSEYAAQFKP